MSDADRAAVLARLQQHDTDPVLLLAVQGGIFAEGSIILVTCSLA